MEKTNVMRLLDKKKIPYTPHCYAGTGALSGLEVAATLSEDPARVFKTLVARGRSGAHYVFLVPVSAELDLKKAAALAGEKAVSLLPQRELLPLTGYVHGGCSPIGMKKQFPTFVHETAAALPTLFCSAGRIGYQIELSPDALAGMLPVVFGDVAEEAVP